VVDAGLELIEAVAAVGAALDDAALAPVAGARRDDLRTGAGRADAQPSHRARDGTTRSHGPGLFAYALTFREADEPARGQTWAATAAPLV
jgi:hypothetical protein